MRPLIGILLDYQDDGSFSSRPHHALRSAYFDAVAAAGGLPVGLGYVPDALDDTLDEIDGLILPGGFYPFPAAFYGEPDDGKPPHPRAAFEIGLTIGALERDLPVLGICAGMQVLGVLRGGIVHRDIHAAVGNTIDHLNEKPAEEVAHMVSVVPGTLLHAITGADEIGVNTAHREGFTDMPDTVTVSAVAPDGTIEAIELPDQYFALGVQWHPEFFSVSNDQQCAPHRRLIEAFIDAAGADSIPREFVI